MSDLLDRLIEECPRVNRASTFSRGSHACGYYFHVLTPWGLVCDEWNPSTARFPITPRQWLFMRSRAKEYR